MRDGPLAADRTQANGHTELKIEHHNVCSVIRKKPFDADSCFVQSI
jgi:hypothetical protein